jgi:hypothetical protein
METMPAGLFVRESGRFVPDPVCAGPWDPGAMHGGPIAALVGRLIADHEADDGDWFLSRLTVELVRPVPVKPVTVRLEIRRPGKRLQLIDAVVLDPDGAEVLVARGLRLRWEDNGLDEEQLEHPDAPDIAGPDGLSSYAHSHERPFGNFFMDALDVRAVDEAEFVGMGPAQVWFKLLVPVMAGESVHPLDRVLTAADFPNGVSRILDPLEHQFINPDLTVSLHRYPANDWVLLDGVSHCRRGGYGMAQCALSDDGGHLGVSVQTLLVAAAR